MGTLFDPEIVLIEIYKYTNIHIGIIYNSKD